MTAAGEALIPHIPYLRRYARALTGSQQRGDQYVKASLETIIEQLDAEGLAPKPRVALFRMFHDVWVRLAPPQASGTGEAGSDGGSVRRLLASMPRRQRQAFLLRELERFEEADIAQILRTNVEEVEKLLGEARRELTRLPAASILIIEDDPVISMGNAQIVQEMGHRVAGTARTEKEALAAFKATDPDLILADVRLADGSSGLEAVAKIMRSTNVPVVYVTGHPEDVLTGKQVEPTYVIEKPFNPEALKAAIAQALSFRNEEEEAV